VSFKPSRISFLPLLCAALLTLLCLLWVRSRWHTTILGFFTPSGHLQAIASDRDGLLLFFSNVPFGQEAAWSADAMSVSADDFATVHDLVYNPTWARTPGHWHYAGFRYARDQLSPRRSTIWDFRAITIPYWLPIVLLLILPLQRLQRWIIRMRRLSRGQCLACGYDLRHSADRCPECGAPRRTSTLASPVQPDHPPIPGRIGRLVIACVVCVIACGISAVVLFRGRFGVASTALRAGPLTGIRLHNQSFGPASVRGVIASIQDATGIRIKVDWRSLNDPTYPQSVRKIEFHVHDTSLRQAVTSAIASAGFLGVRPECYADGNVFYVAAASRSPAYVRAYPVSDLIRQADPTFGVIDDQIRNPTPPTPAETEADRRDSFANLVAQMVYREDWTSNGGDAGWLCVCGDNLIVVQTARGQAAVADLLTALRSAGPEGNSEPAAMPTRDVLATPIRELRLESATLATAAEAISQVARVNIILCAENLSDAGEDLDKRLKVTLSDTNVGSALRTILTRAYRFPGDHEPFAIAVGQDVIIVGGTAGLDGSLRACTRVYNVDDLIGKTLVHYKQRPLRLQPQPPLIADDEMFASMISSGLAITEQDVVDFITRAIEKNVDTDSWKDNGGSLGFIAAFGGKLIIRQTSENQAAIVRVLRTLRAGASKEGMPNRGAPQTSPSSP